MWRISQHNNTTTQQQYHSLPLRKLIDVFVIDKSSKKRFFPFKNVTVPEDPVGNRTAADRREGIPKLFQHTAPRSPCCLPSSPDRPRTWSQPPRRLFPASGPEEVDAVRRSEEEKFGEEKLVEWCPSDCIPSSKVQLRWLTLASAISGTKVRMNIGSHVAANKLM